MSRVIATGARWLATGFGSGYAPIAPGTAGSAVGLLLFWPLARISWPAQVACCVALFLLGTAASGRVALEVGHKDPGLIVVDEVVGMWMTLVALPFSPFTAILGFVFFRAMDVWKPWPARALEALPGGWGVMADDAAAGVYANFIVRVALLVWPPLSGA